MIPERCRITGENLRQDRIDRTPDPGTAVKHMRVNHRSLYITMAQQLLNCPNIIAALQECCRKTVAQRVRADGLAQPRLPRRDPYRLL